MDYVPGARQTIVQKRIQSLPSWAYASAKKQTSNKEPYIHLNECHRNVSFEVMSVCPEQIDSCNLLTWGEVQESKETLNGRVFQSSPPLSVVLRGLRVWPLGSTPAPISGAPLISLVLWLFRLRIAGTSRLEKASELSRASSAEEPGPKAQQRKHWMLVQESWRKTLKWDFSPWLKMGKCCQSPQWTSPGSSDLPLHPAFLASSPLSQPINIPFIFFFSHVSWNIYTHYLCFSPPIYCQATKSSFCHWNCRSQEL